MLSTLLTRSDVRLPLIVRTTNEWLNAEAKNYTQRSTAGLINCQSNQAVLMTYIDFNETVKCCARPRSRGPWTTRL